jgi:hypothetical protein
MSKKIPSSHTLIKMFKWATVMAFRCYPELYDRDVSDHICIHVLTEFVRADSLYWIKDKKGRPIEEIPDMIIEGDVMYRGKSIEKELAVQEHIGNFSLFMSGLFPNTSQKPDMRLRAKYRIKDRVFMELYLTLHPLEHGLDYYIVQGKTGYEKASSIYKGLNDIKASVLNKLSRRFEAYVCLMQTIHEYLLAPSPNIG